METRQILRTFLSGLAVVLPLIVTVAVIAWLVRSAESVLGGALKWLLPESAYIAGMGIAIGLGAIFLVGIAARARLFQSLMLAIERRFNNIPLVKTLYGAVRDLVSLFSRGDGDKRFSKMVAVRWDGQPFRLFGFITMEDFSTLPIKADDDEVAVYLPMSYQIGGYMVLVPRHRLDTVDMPLEDGMRFVITAGMSAGPRTDERSRSR